MLCLSAQETRIIGHMRGGPIVVQPELVIIYLVLKKKFLLFAFLSFVDKCIRLSSSFPMRK